MRSKIFRKLLAPWFPSFLEAGIGFKRDAPLPGPARIASQLRDRTLEVVERWDETFGSSYRQVRSGPCIPKHYASVNTPEQVLQRFMQRFFLESREGEFSA